MLLSYFIFGNSGEAQAIPAYRSAIPRPLSPEPFLSFQDCGSASNLVPRGRDPFGQRRGSGSRFFQRMTKGTPGDEVAVHHGHLRFAHDHKRGFSTWRLVIVREVDAVSLSFLGFSASLVS